MEFVWPIRVYYEDTDAGGVVFYANYLRYMERARTEWLRSLGFEQDELMREPGILFIVRRTEVDYRRAARFNDRLQVVSSLQQVRGASFTFEQRVELAADAQTLCTGLTRVACVTASDLRPAPIPAEIVEKITSD